MTRTTRRHRKIFDLWLACWTQKEIAAAVGLTHKGVEQVLEQMADLPKLPKSDQAAADHATDFEPPLYNIWKQQELKTANPPSYGAAYARWTGGG